MIAGISSQEGKVNDYRNFADEIVPRIKKQGSKVSSFKIYSLFTGYNTIQLMAVMEHVNNTRIALFLRCCFFLGLLRFFV